MSEKKIAKKLIAIAMAAAMCAGTGFMTPIGDITGTNISVNAATATVYESGNYRYTLNDDGTVTIVSYIKGKEIRASVTNMIIPESLGGKTVTAIGKDAFNGSKDVMKLANLTSVTIPATVVSIEKSAFSGCGNLKKVTFAENSQLKNIGPYAFNSCKALTSIEIPASVSSLGESAFGQCAGLETIIFDGPSELKSLDYHAFYKCKNIQHIELPEGLETIGEGAFQSWNSLKTVNIPSSVKTIEDNAFVGCENLEYVNIFGTDHADSQLEYIGYQAFKSCPLLSSIIIPDSVVTISGSAFKDSSYTVPEIVIGDSVEIIGDEAFFLTDVKVKTAIGNPEYIKTINGTAYNVRQSIKLGKSLKKIGAKAFAASLGRNIENFYIEVPETIEEIGTDAFRGCVAAPVIFPDFVHFENIPQFFKEIGTDEIVLTLYCKADKPEITGNSNEIVLSEWGVNSKNAQVVFVSVKEIKELNNLSEISSDTLTLGKTVTVNAKADDGAGEYLYQVLYKQKTQSKWTIAQNYDTNAEVTFKPAKAVDYDVCVKVKDSNGTVVKKFFDVKVNAKLANTSALSAENIVIGQKVTANCLATGGMGGYQYQVLYKQTSQNKWTTAQDFDENTAVTFKPSKTTTYDICIKVKDSEGTVIKKFFTVQVNAKLANTSDISSTEIKKDSTVTVGGSATGGMGDYQYQVLYKQTSQKKWTVKQDFDANSIVSVKPAKTAEYDICIKVQDETGTIAKKYFTVNVIA